MGQRSHEIAFCGVSAAIGTVLLHLGGLIPGATYCAPMLGMLPLPRWRNTAGGLPSAFTL